MKVHALGEAAGLTLAMTLINGATGFVLAFGLVYLRQTPGFWALPLRLACILYVEVFGRSRSSSSSASCCSSPRR